MKKKRVTQVPSSGKQQRPLVQLTGILLLLPAFVFSAPEFVNVSVTLNDLPEQDRTLDGTGSDPNLSPSEATAAVFSALCPAIASQERTSAQNNLLQLCSALGEASAADQSRIYDQISSKANSANANISNLEQSGVQLNANLSSNGVHSNSDKTRTAAYRYQSQIPLYSFLGSSGRSDWDYFYKRINTFTSFDSSFSERDETIDDVGFESIHLKFLFGADYRINNVFLLGTAITLGRSETELANNRGNADSTAINWTLFGLHQINKRWSVNGTFMLQTTDYDNTREISINLPPLISSYSLNAESSAQQTGLLLGSDYQWSLPNAFELSLLNQFNVVRTETDSYSESGNTGFELSINAQEVNNATINNGIEIRKPLAQPWGVLIPQLNIHWVHQFADQSRDIRATFIHDPQANLIAYATDEGDSDYFTAQLGTVFVIPNGINGFAQLSSVLGYEHYSNTTLSIGLRGEF